MLTKLCLSTSIVDKNAHKLILSTQLLTKLWTNLISSTKNVDNIVDKFPCIHMSMHTRVYIRILNTHIDKSCTHMHRPKCCVYKHMYIHMYVYTTLSHLPLPLPPLSLSLSLSAISLSHLCLSLSLSLSLSVCLPLSDRVYLSVRIHHVARTHSASQRFTTMVSSAGGRLGRVFTASPAYALSGMVVSQPRPLTIERTLFSP